MNLVRLRPSIEDLQNGDPHLPEFLRYIEHLVGHNDPRQAAHNAALTYFALVRGMSNTGLMQMDWAPTLMVDVGDIEYEIVLDGGHSAVSETRPASLPEATVTSSLAMSKGKLGATSRIDVFLDSLERGCLPSSKEQQPHCRMLVEPISSAFGCDIRLPTPIGDPQTGDAILHELSRVSILEQSFDRLSRATNHAYWRLGTAYREFCASLENEDTLRSHPRTQQKMHFEALCQVSDFKLLCPTEKDRMRIKKRLQRSRKYDILVDIFGARILDLVPQVCVSRLDAIRSEDLEAVRDGSANRSRVGRIRARIASV